MGKEKLSRVMSFDDCISLEIASEIVPCLNRVAQKRLWRYFSIISLSLPLSLLSFSTFFFIIILFSRRASPCFQVVEFARHSIPFVCLTLIRSGCCHPTCFLISDTKRRNFLFSACRSILGWLSSPFLFALLHPEFVACWN